MANVYDLLPQEGGFSYDEEINPHVTQEFTGAIFRFGHSLVTGDIG